LHRKPSNVFGRDLEKFAPTETMDVGGAFFFLHDVKVVLFQDGHLVIFQV
jgi:hypothetical protein